MMHDANTAQSRDVVRYTRYDMDQEGFVGDVKVHTHQHSYSY